MVFETIVSLNSNRILGRLDSRWSTKRKVQGSKGPSTTRLRSAIEACNSGTEQLLDFTVLLNEAKDLDDLFNKLDQGQMKPDVQTLKVVVQSAYKLTHGSVTLEKRLQQLGVQFSAKAVGQVVKIAKYWGISSKLVEYSRSYRTLFSNLKAERLKPFPPYRLPQTKRDLFVHAEIQMIIHYELSSKTWPRVIGSSKHACFLCNAFIQAHGFFYVSGAHRQVYNLWYVPDLGHYSNKTLARFRTTVAAVHQDIVSEIDITRLARAGRSRLCSMPNQSSTNLRKVFLPTPSISTVASDVTVTNKRATYNTVKDTISVGPASQNQSKVPESSIQAPLNVVAQTGDRIVDELLGSQNASYKRDPHQHNQDVEERDNLPVGKQEDQNANADIGLKNSGLLDSRVSDIAIPSKCPSVSYAPLHSPSERGPSRAQGSNETYAEGTNLGEQRSAAVLNGASPATNGSNPEAFPGSNVSSLPSMGLHQVASTVFLRGHGRSDHGTGAIPKPSPQPFVKSQLQLAKDKIEEQQDHNIYFKRTGPRQQSSPQQQLFISKAERASLRTSWLDLYATFEDRHENESYANFPSSSSLAAKNISRGVVTLESYGSQEKELITDCIGSGMARNLVDLTLMQPGEEIILQRRCDQGKGSKQKMEIIVTDANRYARVMCEWLEEEPDSGSF